MLSEVLLVRVASSSKHECCSNSIIIKNIYYIKDFMCDEISKKKCIVLKNGNSCQDALVIVFKSSMLHVL